MSPFKKWQSLDVRRMSKERKHSILASSSKEWVHCGFSAKFLANKEEETNDASEFATESHALSEAYIRKSLRIVDFDEKAVSIDKLKCYHRRNRGGRA